MLIFISFQKFTRQILFLRKQQTVNHGAFYMPHRHITLQKMFPDRLLF